MDYQTEGVAECAENGCTQPRRKREWCAAHYGKLRTAGLLPGLSRRACQVTGCERDAWARRYCKAHYSRWSATGSAGAAAIRPRILDGGGCRFPECTNKRDSNGLCTGHGRQAALGAPLAPLEARLRSTDRDASGRKLCRRCRNWLDPEEFHANRTPKDGLATRCKVCSRDERLRRTYGISLETYLRMLEEQGGVCLICGGVDDKELAVDHDHRCCPGRSCGDCVRGLLCTRCNLGIGMLGDSVGNLSRAITYLQERAAK